MASLMEALAKAACASARKAKAYTDEQIASVNETFASSVGKVEGLEGYSMRGSASGSVITIDDMRDLPSKVRVKTSIVADGTEGESLVNLVPYPYSDGTEKTINGITFVVNEDGSITVSGTASEYATFILYRNNANYSPFERGNYYTRYHGQKHGVTINFRVYRESDPSISYVFLSNTDYSSNTLVSTAIGLDFYLYIAKGTSFDSPVTIYPMIVEGHNVSISEYVPPIGASGAPSADVTITSTSASDPSIEGETISAKIGETVEFDPIFPDMKISSNREDVALKASYNRRLDKVIEKITDAFIRLGGNV